MKILIVEDEQIFAEVLHTFLTNIQVESKIVSNDNDVIDEISNKDVDSVLIDFTCIDVFAFLGKMRNIIDPTKVLIMGGDIDDLDKKKLTDRGVVHILDKPFSLKTFVSALPSEMFEYAQI